MKNLPQTHYTYKGIRVTFTWIKTDNVFCYQPWTQIYGICFNQEGKILIIKDKEWKIPGGSPEKGELPQETLKRELVEEANVIINHYWPLGVQGVSYPENPDPELG